MITTYINSNYRITYEGVSMVENALGNPNLVQISVTSGCTIVVPGSDENKKFGIDYLPNGEARSWKLNGLNTRINKKEAHFIFARLGRNEESALLVFSTNDYRIDGSVVSGETLTTPASDSFFYIKVGSITATDAVGESATLDREITYDGGYYRTDNYNDTSSGGLGDMFRLTADGLINALKEFASFTVRGTLSVIGKIVLNEKQITGVAREMDDSPVIDDETVPTTAYLNGKYLLELAKKFLRKDADDRTPYKLSSDTAFEVGDFVPGSSGAIVYKDKETGQTNGELDKLRVRMKAYFESLEIVNVNSLGGKQVISPAGSVRLTIAFGAGEKYEIVTEGEDGNDVVTEVTVPQGIYRCFFLAEQDGQEVENRFKVGNQLQSKDFNIKKPGEYNQVANHYYWRLVTGVSVEPVRIGELGYHYVDLSVTDCDTGSDAPAKGDVVAQFGDRNDVDYQNALVFSSVDTFSPSITLYQGINSYSLVGKDVVSYGVDKTTGKAFMNVYGEMYIGDRGGNTFVRYTQDNGVEINGKLAVGTKLGDGKTIEQALEDATQAAIDAANENISDFTDAVTKDIEDLQNQIDGVIESFNGFGAPTLTNFPANEWTTDEERKAHDKDTYTDKTEYVDDVTTPTAGQSWKWQYTSPTDYGWVKIADSDATRALLDAARAQDTADGKRRVFVAQPTAQQAYDVGDLWVNATYGTTYSNDILRAVTAKAAGSPFNISHWTKSSKYTDDTKAEQVQQNVNNLSTTVNTLSGTVSGMKDFTDTAFADGIVDRSEASAIDKYLNNINTTKADAQNAYSKVYENALLDGVAKTNLANAYSAFSASATELVTSITNAIADGKTTSTERADVDAKYTNFNTKYGDFVAYLNAANRYIQDKINSTANNALTQIGGLAYLKQALKEDTTIEGGLIQSSVLALGYTNEGGAYKVMSGTNGIYDAASLGGGIASWWGGAMKDRGNYTASNMPSDVAKALIRMDGSGYLANGGIWWGTDGKIHADPQSFIINENQLGDYLELFQIIYKGGTKEIDYMIPQYVMQKVDVASYVTVGGVKLKKHSDGVLEIEGDLLVTGGVTMYAQGGHTASTILDALPIDTSTLSKDGGVLSVIGGGGGSSIAGIKVNGGTYVPGADKYITIPDYPTSLAWSDITGKPSWIGDSKPSYSFGELTGKPTTLAGYGITDAVTLGTAQTITGHKNFKSSTEFGSDTRGIIIYSDIRNKAGAIEITANGTWSKSCLEFENNGNLTASYSITASSFIKSGGTASQFLKADGSVDSNAYITASALDHIISVDSRSTATNPNTFGNGLRAEFKFNSTNGLSDGGTYNGVLHFKPYGSRNDHSGGYPHQLGFTYNGNIWHRTGVSGTEWNTWSKLLDTNNYAGTLDSRYVKKSGDTMTGSLTITENQNILLRPSNAAYSAGIGYDVNANECIALWAKNTVTRLRWHAGKDMSTLTAGSMMGITPDFEISKASGTATGYIGGNVIWHAGNDGSGSGLDADLLDGVHNGSLTAKLINYDNTANVSTQVQFMQKSSDWKTWEAPSQNWYSVIKLNHGNGDTYYSRVLAFSFFGNGIYTHCKHGNVDTGWSTIAFTTDNVASATKLQTARSIWGQSFDGTGNVSGWLSGATTIECSTGLKSRSICIETGSDGSAGSYNAEINNFISNLYLQHKTSTNLYMCNGGGKVGIGNTSPSYKLHVTGDIYANGGWLRTSGAIGWYNETYGGGWYQTDSEQVRIYNNKVLYLDGIRTWGIGGHNVGLKLASYSHIGINMATNSCTWGLYANNDGNMYIGRRAGNVNDSSGSYIVTITPTGMNLTGNFLATGGITMYSDIRKKNILENFNLPLEKICAAPLFRFTYKDDDKRTLRVGSSAQYWQDVPGIVSTDSEGKYLTMDYNAMLSAVTLSLAKYTKKHETEIEKLKMENIRLRQRIEFLERRVA